MVSKSKPDLPVIGWREWVGLPDLGIKALKVKVDTGARSSSLHAFGVQIFKRDGVKWVRFQVHPVQRSKGKAVAAEAEVLEFRSVRSSSGIASLRPVIVTNVTLLGITWPVELTLASRDIRAFVVGDQVVGAMRRVTRGREFRSNVHRGGLSEPVTPKGGVTEQ